MSKQEIDTEEPGPIRERLLSQRSIRRLSDRGPLEDCCHPGGQQIQPEKLLVKPAVGRLVHHSSWRSLTSLYRNGRWRSFYTYDPSSGTLEGAIKVDVHYYEDGNVRLLTTKPVTASIPSGTGSSILREITTAEKKYQDELNKGFTTLSEGTFKSLRRQLPITRQKIEWEKVAGYRLGQDIGGGSSRR